MSDVSQELTAVSDDMLFDDGLPRPNEEGGFKGSVAAAAAGVTYRQLDYWARTNFIKPTVRGARGSGSKRLYSFRDILVLKLVKRLLDAGVSLQQIRKAVDQLHSAGVKDLAQITLMSDGASVYLCTSNDQVIDLLGQGQGVFGIAVGRVLTEVEASLLSFEEHRAPEKQAEQRAGQPVDEFTAYRTAKLG